MSYTEHTLATEFAGEAPKSGTYWFLLICSMRSVNSLRKRWQSWVFSKVLDIMVSHTGSAILGTEYKFQIVPLQKRETTYETVTNIILGNLHIKE